MSRRRALLGSGVSAITLGNVAIAGSVVAMLASGPRLLGHEAFVGLGLAWTVTTVFGYGLAMPTEQLITRRTSALDPRGTTGPARNLALACTVVCLLIVAMRSGSALGRSEFPLTTQAAVVGLVGWTLLAVVRGGLAGAGKLHSYAVLLGLEAFVRIALVCGAVLAPSTASWLLAASVGVPVVVAALVGMTHRSGRLPLLARPTGGGSSPDGPQEQLTFVLVAAGYQLCLNSAPLVLAWRLDPHLRVSVGAFVIASSYYRLAAVLGGGFATHTLVSLSRSWAEGHQQAFNKQLARGVLGAGAVTAATTAGAAALGPFVVPLLNGRDPRLPGLVVAALAVSTVLATAASVATTGLMASHRGRSAALWWMGGAAVVVGVLTTADSIQATTAVALVAGPAVVLAGVALTAARLTVVRAPGKAAR